MIVRPRLHLTPRSGWVNDPLGLTWHDGRYHLFFQHVPGQTQWGPECRWGHATSPDGLVWDEGPLALVPGDGDDGCWSGSLVEPDHGPARIFYTTVALDDVQVGAVRVADATDPAWTGWVKGAVVAGLPAGEQVVAYRDPWVFRDGDRWTMLVGAGRTDGTALAYAYDSADLSTWTYVGKLLTRSSTRTEPMWTGEVWECPQLFAIDGRWVLTVSVWTPGEPHYEAYAVGDYADHVFTPRHWGRLTYGPSYYAGSAFRYRDGQRGLVHWLRGVEDPAAGWAGAHSLPHRLRLDGDVLVAEPTSALDAVLGDTVVLDGSGERGRSVDGPCDVRWAAEGEGSLTLTDPAQAPLMHLALRDGTLTATTADGTWSMPGGDGRLRVVVDGPVVEVFSTAGTLAFPVPASSRTSRLTLGGPGRAEVRTVLVGGD